MNVVTTTSKMFNEEIGILQFCSDEVLGLVLNSTKQIDQHKSIYTSIYSGVFKEQ